MSEEKRRRSSRSSGKSRKRKRPPERDRGESSKKKWERGRDSSGSGNDYIELKKGANYLKLVEDNFEDTYVHWIAMPDGSKRKVICSAGIENRGNASKKCKVCALADKENGVQTRHNYYFAVLVGEAKKKNDKRVIVFDSTPQILQCGPMLGGQICSLAAEIIDDSDGEWGEQSIESIADISIKVMRIGEKLKTKYEVRPAMSKQIVRGDVGESPNLLEQIRPSPKKDIQEVLDAFGDSSGEYGDEGTDDDDWEDDNFDEPPKRTSSKKPKPPVEEDDDDWDDSDLELDLGEDDSEDED